MNEHQVGGREGRSHEVQLLFPEPTKAGQAAARVNENVRNARSEAVIQAAAEAAAPTEGGSQARDRPGSPVASPDAGDSG